MTKRMETTSIAAPSADLARRAERHAAMGDPVRLAILDALAVSDRTPSELAAQFNLASNLLAFHLDVLERSGIVGRSKSSGDARKRYVHLLHEGIPTFPTPHQAVMVQPALFLCTHNAARSQIAAAMWTALTGLSADSAGTHPADRVHRYAIAAARREGFSLAGAQPRQLQPDDSFPPLVITVCDRVHEELTVRPDWLHWSLPDPLDVGTPAAFDATVRDIRHRITTLLGVTAA